MCRCKAENQLFAFQTFGTMISEFNVNIYLCRHSHVSVWENSHMFQKKVTVSFKSTDIPSNYKYSGFCIAVSRLTSLEEKQNHNAYMEMI